MLELRTDLKNIADQLIKEVNGGLISLKDAEDTLISLEFEDSSLSSSIAVALVYLNQSLNN